MRVSKIPSELLEAVTGISVGEIRTVRVSIPFTTAQLLDINARQMEAESSSDAYHLNSIAKQASAAANSQKKATGEEAEQEGRSLVPLYLKNIANTTKEGLFKSLLGEKKGTTDEETAATPTPKAATAASSGGEAESDKEGLKGNEENMGTQNSEEDGENEEIHHIDCLIQVKCLDVKRRIWPVLDGSLTHHLLLVL
ncbi:hypothetical protein EPH_0055810 [Eimeria praecox]|uniref:Uncharacterized protein n=1 Tax=Eimeria praecox TaxID=51316 RepID=U6GUM9_9EIME|nr:hypothetical protein EPH_0055810 [Eimeria praecox]